MQSQPIPTMTSINNAVKICKEKNPDSRISIHMVRNLIDAGFPVVKTGRSILINLDLLIDYFNGTYTFEKREEE